jgi:hypothetical protein
VPVREQRLVYDNVPMANERTLADYRFLKLFFFCLLSFFVFFLFLSFFFFFSFFFFLFSFSFLLFVTLFCFLYEKSSPRGRAVDEPGGVRRAEGNNPT